MTKFYLLYDACATLSYRRDSRASCRSQKEAVNGNCDYSI